MKPFILFNIYTQGGQDEKQKNNSIFTGGIDGDQRPDRLR